MTQRKSMTVKGMIPLIRLKTKNREEVCKYGPMAFYVYIQQFSNFFDLVDLDAQGASKRDKVVPKLTLGKIKVGMIDSYKSRSARPAFYNQNILLATESADMTTKQGHILLHKNLQLKFLGDENEELRNKVQNLEKMV